MTSPLVAPRLAAIAAGLAGLVLSGGATPVPAVAAPAATPCLSGTPVTGDYDGDGAPDLAVSAWDNWVDGSPLFVSPSRDGQGAWLAIAGDFLRLTSADLNGDVCSDAVVTGGYGAVQVRLVFGTPTGLDPAGARTLVLPQFAAFPEGAGVRASAVGSRHDGLSQVVVAGYTTDGEAPTFTAFTDIFTLDATGTPGTPQVIDMAGLVTDQSRWPASMAADDGVVVVGALDTVKGKARAGSVHVFNADSTDPATLVHRAVITQATAGVAGTVEAGDRFGAALALRDGHLAIGAPHETIGAAKGAGQVQLLRWDAATTAFAPLRALHQGTARVPGTNETGDHFGSTLAIARGLTAAGSWDVVIGTPDENVGSIADAGAVTVANLTKARYRLYSQNTAGVPGRAEKQPSEALKDGEYFGYAVGVLPTSPATDTLAIGAPGETNGDCLTQGYVVLSDGARLAAGRGWTYLKPPTRGCSGYDNDVVDGWGAGFGN